MFAACHNCEVHQTSATCDFDPACHWCDNGLSHFCTVRDTVCIGCNGVVGSGKILDACGVCGGDSTTCVTFNMRLNSDHVTGIFLSLMGNMLISFSLNCQKYAHNLNAKREREGGEAVPYTRMRLWWVGLAMMALGEAGNFLAYAYAPATLVAPLGAVTVRPPALRAADSSTMRMCADAYTTTRKRSSFTIDLLCRFRCYPIRFWRISCSESRGLTATLPAAYWRCVPKEHETQRTARAVRARSGLAQQDMPHLSAHHEWWIGFAVFSVLSSIPLTLTFYEPALARCCGAL
jgi:hypothetical protein